MCKFYRKTSVLEYLFNKAAGLKVCNSIKKRLQHSCLRVKLAKFRSSHPEVFLEKRCSENMQHALRHGCSAVILLHISRATFPRNTSGWLLLKAFTEEFQWLLLTFNWCFQRSSEQKPVWLCSMNNRFSWKKRLLMEVWIWYRCQKRIENYHHDNEQFKNRKKYISKHSA